MTISSALRSAKHGDTIVLEDKTYREKLVVDVRDLTVVGSENSRIVYGDHAKKIHADGMEYNTFRTFTVIVTAKNVTFKDLTIENDAGDPAKKGQEVALSVYADGFFAENVTLKSTQDTLFCGPLPDDLITRYDGFLPDEQRYYEGEAEQLFKNCKVYGSVDYVFGCGTAYFIKCGFCNVDDTRKVAYVAAPAHSLKQKKGFTFIDCTFEKDGDFESKIYLARPWRDYGKATFINCKTDSITDELFDKWSNTDRDKTARMEYFNVTDEASAVGWAKRLDDETAKKYLSSADKLMEKYKK